MKNSLHSENVQFEQNRVLRVDDRKRLERDDQLELVTRGRAAEREPEGRDLRNVQLEALKLEEKK